LPPQIEVRADEKEGLKYFVEKRKNVSNKSQVNWRKCNNAVSKSKMILRRLGGGDEAYY